jgi:hypothetical protein
MLLKRIAGISFAIAFMMAIILFTNIGRNYISFPTAKTIFIVAGAVGLLLNLLSFRSGKQNAGFNFIFWSGMIVLFIGLIFKIMHLPYGIYIVLGGMIITGISFFISSDVISGETNESDLLDD